MHHHHPQHSCSHHHDHGHHHGPVDVDRRFVIAAVINLAFVVTEMLFGFVSQSLALISDATHNFSDVVSLLLAGGAAWLSKFAPTAERTYGYRGATILAALANACLLFLVTGAIIVEAMQRFSHPADVASHTVVWVAALAIAVNAGTAALFWKGQHHDLNVRGAFLHMAGDAAISLGVVIGALIIGATGWFWVDPALSILIAAIIIWSSWGLAKEAFRLSLAAVPKHIHQKEVRDYLAGLPGVTEVHDLHIWAMSTTETALTAHMIRPNQPPDDAFLSKVSDELERRFQIQHATLQIEAGNGPQTCRLAPAEVV